MSGSRRSPISSSIPFSSLFLASSSGLMSSCPPHIYISYLRWTQCKSLISHLLSVITYLISDIYGGQWTLSYPVTTTVPRPVGRRRSWSRSSPVKNYILPGVIFENWQNHESWFHTEILRTFLHHDNHKLKHTIFHTQYYSVLNTIDKEWIDSIEEICFLKTL